MVDKSRLVARWSSSYNYIEVQINDKTQCAIHKQTELPWELIRPMKVRSVRIIASFDCNTNDQSLQFMNKVNCLKNQLDL